MNSMGHQASQRLFRTIAIAFLLLLAVATPSTPAGNIAGISPTASDAFADSVGVDTHFNYPGTPYTNLYDTIAADLINSGIRHIQDGGPKFSRPKALAYLGRHGITHSLGFPTDTTAQEITTTLAANAPFVDFVEPQNEFDVKSKTVPDWATQWRNEQELLYRTVRSDPADARIKVLGPAIGHIENARELGSLDQFEDAGSMHIYPCNVNPGDTVSNVSLIKILPFERLVHPSKPIWTTEVGYPDDLPDGRCALSDAVIAKYLTRTVAERWLAHQPRTYFYQFSDMGDRHGYDSMGLVTADGVPKPQYRALKSLLHLAADPGGAISPTPLKYSLTGETDDVQQLLLEKRGKKYLLLLWLEVPSWDEAAHAARDIRAQHVTIVLNKTPTLVRQYNYVADWSFRSVMVAPSQAIRTLVDDSITIVELQD